MSKTWEYLFPGDFDDYCRKNKIPYCSSYNDYDSFKKLGKLGWEICPIGDGRFFAKREAEEPSIKHTTSQTSSPSPDYWFAR